MNFLEQTLGIHISYMGEDLKSFPNYIHSRYQIRKVLLDKQEALFVYPKGELDSVDAIKKHLKKIESIESGRAVLVLEHLTYRQKQYILREKIPFIVEGKQIYLPFMGIYLQERSDAEKKETVKMLPSAQLLLLYYIYNGCGEMVTSDACTSLSFTATSISRASRQLEDMQLIETEKRGVQKVMRSDKNPEELFNAAKDIMCNPVKRTIYVPKEDVQEAFLISGYSALSEFTMINPSPVEYRAADSISAWENNSSSRIQNADEQFALELWRYDPRKLSDGACVDRLSLALALKDNSDERIEEAVEEMLQHVWRDIDGKGN